jgi:hypothetical protein
LPQDNDFALVDARKELAVSADNPTHTEIEADKAAKGLTANKEVSGIKDSAGRDAYADRMCWTVGIVAAVGADC